MDLPNELLILIGVEIDKPNDLNSLLKTNRHLSLLLTPLLYEFAILETNGENALHSAARGGHVPLARLLLERKGFDVNVEESDNTPLIQAAIGGSKEMVEFLLQKGARNLASENLYKHSALHYAAFHGYDTIVEILLENGYDINAHGDGILSETPLHCAATLSGNESTVGLLLSRGAQPNPQDFNGRTPLHNAANSANVLGIEVILKAASMDAFLDAGIRAALCVAADNGQFSIAWQLLRGGADPNIPDDDGWTPLHRAAHCGRKAIVELLLEYGANIEARDTLEETPLFEAVKRDKHDVVKLLVEAGADVASVNRKGVSVMDCAPKPQPALHVSDIVEEQYCLILN